MITLRKPMFYTPANGILVPQIIDEAKINSQGAYIGVYSGETLEQIAARYPDAQIGDCDDIVATREAMMKTDPVEIMEDQYVDMLEVLPPEDFKFDTFGSSFKMSEYLSGRITNIYATYGKRYFMLTDVASLPHSEIIRKIQGLTAKA